MTIQASVVVPTYKRPDLLRKCLNALIHQEFTPDAYEIIIVDDAGSEETRSLVDHFSKQADSRPAICYAAATESHGPAAARNLGWQRARAEIIAFTDDDCLPDPDWLREGVVALRDDLAGVSGQVIVPIPPDPTDYEKNVSRLSGCEFVTANCFYRRSALQAAGGFDERFTMAWREDSDLLFHLLKLSCKLGSAPLAKVVHPVRPARWGISLREQHKSKFEALLYKKYPHLYNQRIYPARPLRYYAILFSLAGGLLALLAGQRVVAIILLLLWAGLTVQFILLRLHGTSHRPSHIAEMAITSILIPPLSIFWRLVGAFQYRVFFF